MYSEKVTSYWYFLSWAQRTREARVEVSRLRVLGLAVEGSVVLLGGGRRAGGVGGVVDWGCGWVGEFVRDMVAMVVERVWMEDFASRYCGMRMCGLIQKQMTV